MSHSEEEFEFELGCRGHGDAPFDKHDGFPLAGDRPRYPRDRSVDVGHIRLDISLDLDEKRIAGTVTHSFRPLNDGLTRLELDSVELEIEAVENADGRALDFETPEGRLLIDLGRPHSSDEDLAVSVRFAGSPRRGLYFIGPDDDYPNKRLEAWTQGQDEDSRHWFPCYDYPNEMATSEMHATVREPFTVVGNGEATGTESGPEPGSRTFHWRQTTPHVTYLLSLCAGDFAELKDEANGIPLLNYVPRGREADGEALFRNTADILQLFSERTGIPYPYPKYAQTVVQDFIFGGMENISATTLTDAVLYDERARLDVDADFLIAHEAAHQWFGDLLTCRDWSHGWLNEGFATFFELIYSEHNKGTNEYLNSLRSEMDLYLSEAGRYRRPVVTNVYNEPIDLFDRHLYEKGGIILNMLRVLIGEDLFWKAIRHYAAANRGRNVVTADLQRSFEEATGRNLDWFFDQWVFAAGHPELEGKYEWDAEAKTARLKIKQKQTGNQVSEAFRLPLAIHFQLQDGESVSTSLEINEREQGFHFPLASKPEFVRLDGRVLMQLDLDRPAEMLRTQLSTDTDVLGRIDAARALAKKADKETIAALGKATREDPFWGVQAEAARALGKAGTKAALDELLSSLEITHPKARRAVTRTLGEYRDERAAEALERVIREGDASYYVEAAAAAAIGKTRSAKALAALELALSKDSQNETIRLAAFEGLGELKDPAARAIALEWTARGRPANVRGAAATALGSIGEILPDNEKSEAVDHLIGLLDDSWFRTQMSSINALRTLKDPKAIGPLESLSNTALDGRTIRSARLAVKTIRETRDKGGDLKALRADLGKLVDENRELRDRLEKLETRVRPEN